MDRPDESLSNITKEISLVSRKMRGSMCLATALRNATNLSTKLMPTTPWDAACGVIERHLRVANSIATFVKLDDQGRIDETTLTPSFKR